ncbi:OLC1v1024417C1 [Oldenlandia corymbosa var. corymbosa]|uniref:OLC1v1024417C1 n=1 Tax=Oldenlandia corymbosa var. corymbosa TaxID=529605 RepID=A0AAV1C312_OLDCO|nr:OLC1v1024417C1 [Oldenlandia corymbosa var. corymbosa]
MEITSFLGPYATIWLTTLLLFFISKHFFFNHKKKLHSFPPGPKPWPIIGNLNALGPLPHRSLHHLSTNYGPIMQLRLGSIPVVVGSSAEMAKVFLKTMDANFAERPKTAAGKYTNYNYSDIVWSNGPYWRQARKICQMQLFSPERLESYKPIRVEEMNYLLLQIFKSSGKPVVLKDHLLTMSINMISRMTLGKKYLVSDEEKSNNVNVVSSEEFKKMLDEWFILNGVFYLGDAIPWLGFVDIQGYIKRMKEVSKKFDRFLEHVLDEHIENKKNADDHKDMVDVLLELSNDPTLEVKLERHGVKAFTQDLLVGGTESSTVTVEWAISELLKNPKLFNKANQELDRVIGHNRWVDEKDLPNLPYIEAIIKETMRLHPVVPLLVPRCAREDCKVAGYDIKKGTQVLVNTWTIGRDPESWENPEEFNPDRFLGKDIDIKGHHYELLPFGSGRRMCMGYSLGLKVVQSNLANLLHGFQWRLPSDMSIDDLNLEETSGISTPKKIPLAVVVEPRLPRHLYSM